MYQNDPFAPKIDTMQMIQKARGVLLVGLLMAVSVCPDAERIDLKNGYTAECYAAQDKIDMATSAVVGEVSCQKTGSRSTLKPNAKYNQVSQIEWSYWYTMVCRAADSRDGDKNITDEEAQAFLEDITKFLINQPPPVEYFGK